jgi:hypothetical protein
MPRNWTFFRYSKKAPDCGMLYISSHVPLIPRIISVPNVNSVDIKSVIHLTLLERVHLLRVLVGIPKKNPMGSFYSFLLKPAPLSE